jgi:hypothetical protein
MNNQTILKDKLEDLPDEQRALIDKAAEEFREKCLLSYSRTRDSVIQKTPLPRVLLHGQSDPNEEAEVRVATQMVHKTIYEAFTNHKQVLTNTIACPWLACETGLIRQGQPVIEPPNLYKIKYDYPRYTH